jgi:uncharacterized protein YkwD
MRAAKLLVVFALVACGGSKRESSSPTSSTSPAAATDGNSGGDDGSSWTETKVIDGKKYTITHTKKTVPAEAAPDRAADPYPADALVKYNVDAINAYRKKHGAPMLKYDAKISVFATAASKQLSGDHKAHAYFNAHIKTQLGGEDAKKGKSGFGSRGAENQGDWDGVPRLDKNDLANGKQQIDVMMKLMYDEGPGGGHHDNMLNPKFKRVGIGLVYAGDKLYLTNDFSD